jgi:hypothetical protein
MTKDLKNLQKLFWQLLTENKTCNFRKTMSSGPEGLGGGGGGIPKSFARQKMD